MTPEERAAERARMYAEQEAERDALEAYRIQLAANVAAAKEDKKK